MLDLTYFFWPRSIAMIGATADSNSIRGRIQEFLIQRKYSGTLFLVSPREETIHGQPVYKSILGVPGKVDLALIAVRADLIESILFDCAEAGVKFAVCFSSGFAEEGEVGRDMQERLSAIAHSRGIRICGPNTAGFFNVKGMISATFTRSVDTRRPASEIGRLVGGPVGIVAQSGGLGFALQHRCALQHGLGLSYIVTTGNEVDLEALDFVDYYLDDPETRVILLTLEGLKDASRLREVAVKAADLGKAIVVSKFGRTPAGSRAAISHAARLTGSDSGYDAAFHRYGLVRVDDEDEMIDFAAAFTRCPPLRGNRIGIVTTSGGAGVWMADACESAGLVVPLLSESMQSALSRYVPSFGSTLNPVDLTAQVSINPGTTAGNAKSPLLGTLTALAESPELDAIVLIANLSDGQVLKHEYAGLKAFVQASGKPFILYSHAMPSSASLELAWELGLTCFTSTRRASKSLQHLYEFSKFDAEVHNDHRAPLIQGNAELPASTKTLCEYEAKTLLREHGIHTPEEALVTSTTNAVEQANILGGPIALKIQSPQIPHKTDVGGIALNIKGDHSIKNAYETVVKRAQSAVPNAVIHGVLVQKMQKKGLEIAIGIVRDRDFGPMMMVGLGGVHVEVFGDAVFDLLPINRSRALAMLQKLKGSALLYGTRGEPARDLDALAVLMEQLSNLVVHKGALIREVDLNPVFVYESGKGAVVIDAMIVTSQ